MSACKQIAASLEERSLRFCACTPTQLDLELLEMKADCLKLGSVEKLRTKYHPI